MKKVIIAGSRGFDDFDLLCHVMGSAFVPHTLSIISGGARGADQLGIRYAERMRLPLDVMNADWATHGKSAGYKRNVAMADEADALVAFWDGESKGTKHMIDIASAKGLLTIVIKYKEGKQ